MDLPETHAHKSKVTFELFALTPGGPERMRQGDAHAKAGKAVCRIPIHIPNYKDDDGNSLQEVEYYFTAKHSESTLLDGSKSPKVVDGFAERLFESHILPGVVFVSGKSVPHPGHAAALKGMCERIGAWREKHPEGKLAVFGHADAVGKEEPNKAVSERRAKAVFGFLVKDAGAWSDLDKEERWDLTFIQDLLKHLGHDPGALDGKDGPKTQAAVKAFQKAQGLMVDGVAGPQTRGRLYQAFMDDCNSLELKAKEFDDIHGSPTAGCSEFNRVDPSEDASEANRRVAVLFLKSNKNFPIRYPCAKGDIGACKRQVAKNGERRTAGFGCCFYDGLVVEKADGAPGSDTTVKVLQPVFMRALRQIGTFDEPGGKAVGSLQERTLVCIVQEKLVNDICFAEIEEVEPSDDVCLYDCIELPKRKRLWLQVNGPEGLNLHYANLAGDFHGEPLAIDFVMREEATLHV